MSMDPHTGAPVPEQKQFAVVYVDECEIKIVPIDEKPTSKTQQRKAASSGDQAAPSRAKA